MSNFSRREGFSVGISWLIVSCLYSLLAKSPRIFWMKSEPATELSYSKLALGRQMFVTRSKDNG